MYLLETKSDKQITKLEIEVEEVQKEEMNSSSFTLILCQILVSGQIVFNMTSFNQSTWFTVLTVLHHAYSDVCE